MADLLPPLEAAMTVFFRYMHIASACVLLSTQSALAGNNSNDGPLIGLDDLIKRIGLENVPTGAGVIIAQVEAPNGNGNFYPNPGHAEFVGKMFTQMSGASASSGHATNVGKNFYGLTISVAPSINDIYLWEVNHWLDSGFLNVSSPGSTPPLAVPKDLKLFNHSWVGSGGNAFDNIVLRRADFVAVRDDLLMMVGVNNGGASFPLLSHNYNGLSIGLMGGGHTSSSTGSGIDGQGRQKPNIVAPGSATSWSTPVLGAAAAMMIETARTYEGLSNNPNAQRSEVIKAVLLAGAAKTDAHGLPWTNEPFESGSARGRTITPLDDVIGAGTVNVNYAHMILTGIEQDGTANPPASTNIASTGWDLTAVSPGESRYYRFSVQELADAITILVTWHRQVAVGFTSNDWAVADFKLVLWRVDKNGNLATLVGDPGLDFFESGNVTSESFFDNIELLYINGLAAGQYTLELSRNDGLEEYPNWDAAVAWLLPNVPGNPADLDGDGSVGTSDLLILLAGWGVCADCGNCVADIDGDCSVGTSDLLILLGSWGL